MKEKNEWRSLLLVFSTSWSTTNTSDGFPFHEAGTKVVAATGLME